MIVMGEVAKLVHDDVFDAVDWGEALQSYRGNTNDVPTFLDVVDKRKVRFEAQEIALVGDVVSRKSQSPSTNQPPRRPS